MPLYLFQFIRPNGGKSKTERPENIIKQEFCDTINHVGLFPPLETTNNPVNLLTVVLKVLQFIPSLFHFLLLLGRVLCNKIIRKKEFSQK